jgi:hypothetical protein
VNRGSGCAGKGIAGAGSPGHARRVADEESGGREEAVVSEDFEDPFSDAEIGPFCIPAHVPVFTLEELEESPVRGAAEQAAEAVTEAETEVEEHNALLAASGAGCAAHAGAEGGDVASCPVSGAEGSGSEVRAAPSPLKQGPPIPTRRDVHTGGPAGNKHTHTRAMSPMPGSDQDAGAVYREDAHAHAHAHASCGCGWTATASAAGQALGSSKRESAEEPPLENGAEFVRPALRRSEDGAVLLGGGGGGGGGGGDGGGGGGVSPPRGRVVAVKEAAWSGVGALYVVCAFCVLLLLAFVLARTRMYCCNLFFCYLRMSFCQPCHPVRTQNILPSYLTHNTT